MINDPTAHRQLDQQHPDAALAVALARLEASRAGLRGIMLPPRRSRAPRSEPPTGEGHGDFWQWVPDSLRGAIDQLSRLLRKHPVASLVVDAVGDWWQHHPVRAAASVAGSEVAQAAGPLIRRYPVAAVAIAALAGATLVASRPWRWRVFGGSTRPLHRRLARWMAAQVPLQAALGTLIALLADQARQAASRAARPDPATAPAASAAETSAPP
ncbi:MAG TPA: hypothetical protein VLA16_05835 [Ideonella sp.]|nr:hypothetical protein [Ideonella sp.]